MGLKQDFKFQFNSTQELKDFIMAFSANYLVEEFEEYYVISPKENSSFTFHVSIESHGFTSDRAGEYFKFLGIFIEELTGTFGEILIEDTC